MSYPCSLTLSYNDVSSSDKLIGADIDICVFEQMSKLILSFVYGLYTSYSTKVDFKLSFLISIFKIIKGVGSFS